MGAVQVAVHIISRSYFLKQLEQAARLFNDVQDKVDRLPYKFRRNAL